MKKIIALAVIIINAANSFAQQKINHAAPNFTLADVKGKMISLSDFKGKVVLLDFWASWCPPCRAANPKQVKLYNNLKDKGFVILGVSVDQNPADWKKAVTKDKITYPQVNDPHNWEAKTAQLYGIEQLPTTLLIDKNGMAQYADLEGKELEIKIQELLKP